MIRPAKATDIPAIEGMLRDMLAESKYADRVAISDKAMRETLLALVMNQQQLGPHSSMMIVSESGGIVVGFVAGQLDRVYHIGRLLRANDVFLYVQPGQPLKHTLALLDAYIGWASANPKVIEIVLSWTDTLPGAARIGDLYQRKGFARIGEIYEMRRDAVAQENAA